MPFDSSDFLKLARELCNQADQPGLFSPLREACIRTAISRSYYAAFWHGRSFLTAFNHKLPLTKEEDHEKGRGSHKLVLDHFRNEVPNGRRIAGKLRSLQIIRNQADYDSVLNDQETLKLRSLERANQIIRLVNELHQSTSGSSNSAA